MSRITLPPSISTRGGLPGEILFSGRDYADSDNAANYTSTLTGDAFQYNGTVRLDQRAALQLVNYVQEGGTLAMGRQTSSPLPATFP